jgi:hypothetical protein
MKPPRAVVAILGGVFVLAAAAQLDTVRIPAPDPIAIRGDRLDVSEHAPPCRSTSVMAACADDTFTASREASAGPHLVQVFEKPGETILVRAKLGD